MEDILMTYKRPYDPTFPLVCMDETSKQQLLDTRESIPTTSGKPTKFDTEYERNGTSNIFMAFEPLAGKRFIQVTDQRTKIDWAYCIKKLVDEVYPDAKKII